MVNGIFILLTFLIGLSPINSDGIFQREILKSGSHRELVTKILISADNMALLEPKIECKLLSIETLPSGAYVDPYQLAALKQHNGPDFFLKDIIDLEQPEFMSRDFKLLIYSNMTRMDANFTSQYTLPVHLRYHAISSSDEFAVVTFPSPEVSIRCMDKETNIDYQVYKGKSVRKITEVCDSYSKHLCDWTQLQLEQATEAIKVKMPVGKVEHFYLVTIGTVITTVLGCVYLILVAVKANFKHKPD